MQIRTNIFIWVFLATIVPLTALTLGATHFSEQTYQHEVTLEVLGSLGNISKDVERHLQANNEMVAGIARSTAVQALLPALASIKQRRVPSNINILRSRVNRYFEGFQTILPDSFFLRILDSEGNTLIKVSHTTRSAAVYENLTGLPYVEQEINEPDFIKILTSLPANEASAIQLPHNKLNETLQDSFPLFDYLVPLYDNDNWVGALSLTILGESIDRILNNAARLYKGKIILVENNPDVPARHGQILYDKERNIQIAQIRTNTLYIKDKNGHPLLESVVDQPQGMYQSELGKLRNYYVELIPYPNRLLSWVIASSIDNNVVSAPFSRIRIGIGLFVAIALVIMLLLTDIGARKIARPLSQLAGQLKDYANGDHAHRAEERQSISEISELACAFNYMADTLDTARRERDHAQYMMLQSNKLASIGQMAAGIGHEINNPLNNILSYNKLIRRSLDKHADVLEEKTRRHLQDDLNSLRTEALRASEIIKGILNFARQVPPHYSCFDVQIWLQNTLALVQQSAKTRNIHIMLECNYNGTLEGDRSQLQQAMINLLLNAIQASENNAEILIHCENIATKLIIKIRDSGCGINEQSLINIFDPFFTTKAEGEGSGLGLSISLGIIEYHQGTLSISNNHDQGVTATVILPLRPEQDQRTSSTL